MDIQLVDLEDLESVKAFAEEYKSKHTQLHVLVNNAGIFMPQSLKRTKQGFDQQMGTNHYSHFVLTTQLLPLLAATPKSRVVNVSSNSHKNIATPAQFKRNFDSEEGYEAYPGYARSKTANILFVRELSKHLRAAGVAQPTVLSAQPGFSSTNAQNADKTAFTKAVLGMFTFLFAMPAERGGMTSMYILP